MTVMVAAVTANRVNQTSIMKGEFLMEVAVKLTPEIIEVETQSLSIPEQARAMKIMDAETYARAGEFWKEIRAIRKKVGESFDPLIKHAHDLHKATLAKKGEIDKPLEDAERFVKAMMSAYDAEQERIRKAEEARLAEIARKAAEEQALLEAIAAEEEAKRNGATAQEAAQEAEAVMSELVYVAPVVLPKTTPKLAGGPVYRTIWKFRIKDVNAIPRQYMVPNETAIGGVVRSLKGQTNIPGVEVYEERC